MGKLGRTAARPVKCRHAGSNDSFAYKYQPSRLSCTTTINRPRIVNYDSENTIGRGPGARTVVFIGKRYLLLTMSIVMIVAIWYVRGSYFEMAPAH